MSAAVKKKYVLALDQGTTGSTALLFDHELNIKGRAYCELPQHFPQSGWVEHDPEDILASIIAVGRDALSSACIRPEEVIGIGITNQRETTLLWDRATGQPVHPAIVWQCRRSAHICDQWRRSKLSDMVRHQTGLELDAYFSASKVRWLIDNVRGVERRARDGDLAFGTVDTWLLWRLTNGKVHATDPSNASRTMMYDIHYGAWAPELLSAFGIPASILPQVMPSGGVFAEVPQEFFGAPIAVRAMAGDQQAALFGQACFAPGRAKNTYGTGCFLMMHTGREAVASKNGLLTTVAWKAGSDEMEYALEGSVFSAGSAVQWLRDGIQMFARASDSEALAESVPDNGGVYLVPAFTGLGAPHWDMYARGTILGLGRDTTRGHIARATLEAVAYQTRDVLEAMQKDSRNELESLRVDGGMVVNDLLMQFQADILGVPVSRPRITETTALGVGCLAGLSAGMWRTRDEIAQYNGVEKTYEPRMKSGRREELYRGWQRAVERAKSWVRSEAPVRA